MRAKPDIVIAGVDDGPLAAVELKCFLYDAKPSTIPNLVWADIEYLGKFKQRYNDSLNAFAIVLVDIDDVEVYEDVRRELKRVKESWMTHYLQVHVVNLYCDENLRQRNGYVAWTERWLNLARKG